MLFTLQRSADVLTPVASERHALPEKLRDNGWVAVIITMQRWFVKGLVESEK